MLCVRYESSTLSCFVLSCLGIGWYLPGGWVAGVDW